MKFKIGDKVLCYNPLNEVRVYGTIVGVPTDGYYDSFYKINHRSFVNWSEKFISSAEDPNVLLKEIL